MYMRNGDREMEIESKSMDVALSSARVWKWYGAGPFMDEAGHKEFKVLI